MDYVKKHIQFGYVNARLRASRSLYLSESTLNDLIDVKTVTAMTEILSNTAYSEYLKNLQTRYSGPELISKVVLRRFTNKVEHIKSMVVLEKRHLLYVVLGKYDVFNLKILFLEHFNKEEFKSDYVRTGYNFNWSTLKKMRDVTDLKHLINIVKDKGYHIREESKTYSEIIEDIERSYYNNLKSLKHECYDELEVRTYIEKLIDHKNFDLALRKTAFTYDLEYLEGGSINKEELSVQDFKTIEDVVNFFKVENFCGEKCGDISWLEELYERKITDWVIHQAFTKPFSIIGVVGYIRRLDNERRNIRSIAVSKGIMTPEEIKAKLIKEVEL
jgi:vacuolar-type H+-ATPase subunit C/Vma6